MTDKKMPSILKKAFEEREILNAFHAETSDEKEVRYVKEFLSISPDAQKFIMRQSRNADFDAVDRAMILLSGINDIITTRAVYKSIRSAIAFSLEKVSGEEPSEEAVDFLNDEFTDDNESFMTALSREISNIIGETFKASIESMEEELRSVKKRLYEMSEDGIVETGVNNPENNEIADTVENLHVTSIAFFMLQQAISSKEYLVKNADEIMSYGNFSKDFNDLLNDLGIDTDM